MSQSRFSSREIFEEKSSVSVRKRSVKILKAAKTRALEVSPQTREQGASKRASQTPRSPRFLLPPPEQAHTETQVLFWGGGA